MTLKIFFGSLLLLLTNPRKVISELHSYSLSMAHVWGYIIASFLVVQIIGIALTFIPGYESVVNGTGETTALSTTFLYTLDNILFLFISLYISYKLFAQFGKRVPFPVYGMLFALMTMLSLIPLLGIATLSFFGNQLLLMSVAMLLFLYVLVLVFTTLQVLFEISLWKVILITFIEIILTTLLLGFFQIIFPY